MKIKMLTLAAGPEGVTLPGSIVDIDEAAARQLIRGCYAIAMEADNGNNKTTPSSGTAKPRRGKTASAE